MKNRNEVFKIVLSSMLVAIGLILPFITGQIPEIGKMLLPMHIPVLLAGLICGGRYGLLVGIITPLLRSSIFGLPPMYPMAISMAFELGTYGLISGLVFNRKNGKKDLGGVFIALLSAMVIGRLIWGLAMLILLGMKNKAFTLEAFLGGALLNAIPGIILQLVLIPVIMGALIKRGRLNGKKL